MLSNHSMPLCLPTQMLHDKCAILSRKLRHLSTQLSARAVGVGAEAAEWAELIGPLAEVRPMPFVRWASSCSLFAFLDALWLLVCARSGLCS